MTAIEDTVLVIGEQAHDVRILLDGYGVPTVVLLEGLDSGPYTLEQPWLGVIAVGAAATDALRVLASQHFGFALLHPTSMTRLVMGGPPTQVLLPFEHGHPYANPLGLWSCGMSRVLPNADRRHLLVDYVGLDEPKFVPLGIVEACVHTFVEDEYHYRGAC